jgi:alpha-tubulin suppressor-like RCC1 family protein
MDLAAAGYATCALDIAGQAYCWGWAREGTLGSGLDREDLCGGTPYSRISQEGRGCSARPVAVAGGQTFRSITMGAWAACGLTGTGQAYCWGENRYGQLGNGQAYLVSDVPVAVTGGLAFDTLFASAQNVCGLTDEGAAWCWGKNDMAQLSLDPETVEFSAVPVHVADTIAFQALSVGGHACGLDLEGHAWCWGANYAGEVGVEPSWVNEYESYVVEPVSVSDLVFLDILVGPFFTCGRAVDDVVYCWGSGAPGFDEYGDPDAPSQPFAVPTYGRWQVLAPYGNLTCGINMAGETYCWGKNSYGEAGVDIDVEEVSQPTLLGGGLTLTTVHTAEHHACGITDQGMAVCWGSDFHGQIGDGTPLYSATPVPVDADFEPAG